MSPNNPNSKGSAPKIHSQRYLRSQQRRYNDKQQHRSFLQKKTKYVNHLEKISSTVRPKRIHLSRRPYGRRRSNRTSS